MSTWADAMAQVAESKRREIAAENQRVFEQAQQGRQIGATLNLGREQISAGDRRAESALNLDILGQQAAGQVQPVDPGTPGSVDLGAGIGVFGAVPREEQFARDAAAQLAAQEKAQNQDVKRRKSLATEFFPNEADEDARVAYVLGKEAGLAAYFNRKPQGIDKFIDAYANEALNAPTEEAREAALNNYTRFAEMQARTQMSPEERHLIVARTQQYQSAINDTNLQQAAFAAHIKALRKVSLEFPNLDTTEPDYFQKVGEAIYDVDVPGFSDAEVIEAIRGMGFGLVQKQRQAQIPKMLDALFYNRTRDDTPPPPKDGELPPIIEDDTPTIGARGVPSGS